MEKDVETMNLWRRFLRWYRREAYWEQSAATNHLLNAWVYLYRSFQSAAANERGKLLPEQQEALDILHKLGGESLDKQSQIL